MKYRAKPLEPLRLPIFPPALTPFKLRMLPIYCIYMFCVVVTSDYFWDQRSIYFVLQLRGPAAALSRKFLHDLTTARHYKKFFFCNMHNKNIYNENWKFQLRGNISGCAGAFQLLRGRAPAQLRGNIVLDTVTAHRFVERAVHFSWCRDWTFKYYFKYFI
jgi:hypothetical protein